MAADRRKKKRFRLKKRARRTIASLLLVSALIISFIPTRQDAQAYVSPAVEVMDLNSVLNTYDVVDGSETSVDPNAVTDKYMAFPLLEEVTVTEYNGTPHTYYSINTSGMTGDSCVPIFKMGNMKKTVEGIEGNYNALVKYVGYGNDYNPTEIDLTKSVCYNSKPEGELKNYYEKGSNNQVIYCVEEYTGYNDKQGNSYNILHIKKQTVDYDPSDEEDQTWANAHPDPKADDWVGHFGVKAGSETYTDNLCFNRSTIDFLCDEAFVGTMVDTINIPTELYDLGNRTFKNCTNLKKVTVGNKVRTIGDECFYGCVSLSSINIYDCSYLEKVGDGAMAKCGFSSLQLPNHDGMIVGAAAFYGCYNLTDSLDSEQGMFGKYAETGSSNTAYIGPYAYACCTSLTEIGMYARLKSITSGGKEDHEYEGLFAGCTNLKHVELPSEYGNTNYNSGTAVTLGEYTFHRCTSLEYVRFYGRNAKPHDNYQFVTTASLDYAMEEDSSINTPTVADSFVIWGPNPYPESPNEAASHISAGEYSNTYMYIDNGGNRVYELSLGGYVFNFGDNSVAKIIPTSKAQESLTIPATIGDVSITSVAASAYDSKNKNSDRLKTLTIPDTVTSVGAGAFSGAKGLEKVFIDTKGISVGNEAFSEEPKLKYVRFGQTVAGGDTTIGNKCFYNCPSLLEVDFRDDAYDSDAIYDVNVTSIGTDAFKTNRQSSFSDSDLSKAGLNRLGSSACTVSGLWLVMKGSIDEKYVPYRFALNLSSSDSADLNTEDIMVSAYTEDGFLTMPLKAAGLLPVKVFAASAGANKVSTKYNSYITYASGNPDNISIRYNEDSSKGETGTSLLTYPTLNTTVGKTTDESGETTDVLISDIVRKKQDGKELQETEVNILNKLSNIVVPPGVENIDQAVNSADASAEYMSHIYGTVNGVEDGVHTITLNVSKLPDDDGIFEEDKYLTNIIFNKDIKEMGNTPFTGCDSLSKVSFNAEGNKEDATPENPYYWCENGIVYSYDGKDTTLEEVLPGRGLLPDIPADKINASNDPELAKVTKIAKGAFSNCDGVKEVDLTSAEKLTEIPENCFYGCDNLTYVSIPESVGKIGSGAFMDCYDKIRVRIPGKETYINDDAFVDTDDPTIITYRNYAPHKYADSLRYNVELLDNRYVVKFYDHDGTLLSTQDVDEGKDAVPPEDPKREGYKFTGWKPDYKNITADTDCIAQYELDESSTTTTTTTSSSKKSSSGGNKSGDGGNSSGGSNNGSSSSNSGSSSSKSSGGKAQSSSNVNSSTVPIVISGYATKPANSQEAPSAFNGGTVPSTASPQASGVPGGKTTVISTADGITDVGKMSANVNGSSDNYVVKITETQEANDAALNALTAEFGSLDNIRYLPFDISLYDSTGTTKITPVPAGVTVSITMPLPDALAIYGGNNKIAYTGEGSLQKISPRFSVINSVPCMTFTVSHLSPYVIYVDTNNLVAEGTLDATPKTGDMIHPKWFLVIGLVAVALFMFLKRDNEEVMAAA